MEIWTHAHNVSVEIYDSPDSISVIHLNSNFELFNSRLHTVFLEISLEFPRRDCKSLETRSETDRTVPIQRIHLSRKLSNFNPA
jgi:hypothetical protein